MENRNEERTGIGLRAVVQVKQGPEDTWKEVATVYSISRNGAGFELSRPCKVGRLVALVLPMPPELRAYDLNREAYPIMGLVQYCKETQADDATYFHVGVAFIGKDVPESYKINPEQSYRICGTSSVGLWRVTEVERDFVTRGTRYWLNLDVTLSLIKRKKKVEKEEAVIQNIGEGGAAVFSSLDAEVGDKVKLACKILDFHTIAVVRDRKTKETDGEKAVLHREFLEQRIPIQKLQLAQMLVHERKVDDQSKQRNTQS